MNPRLDGVKICVDMPTPRLPRGPYLVATGQPLMSGLQRLRDRVAPAQLIGVSGGIVFLAEGNGNEPN